MALPPPTPPSSSRKKKRATSLKLSRNIKVYTYHSFFVLIQLKSFMWSFQPWYVKLPKRMMFMQLLLLLICAKLSSRFLYFNDKRGIKLVLNPIECVGNLILWFINGIMSFNLLVNTFEFQHRHCCLISYDWCFTFFCENFGLTDIAILFSSLSNLDS